MGQAGQAVAGQDAVHGRGTSPSRCAKGDRSVSHLGAWHCRIWPWGNSREVQATPNAFLLPRTNSAPRSVKKQRNRVYRINEMLVGYATQAEAQRSKLRVA